MTSAAKGLIARLSLTPHPEGGWYRELHRSQEWVRRQPDSQPRSAITVIAYLLCEGERSGWHRVMGADEIWQHGAGAPLEIWRIQPSAAGAQRLLLGPLSEADQSPEPVGIVPAGWWQAARSLGEWSLVYCSVGPGFSFADFQLMRDLPPQERPEGADPNLL